MGNSLFISQISSKWRILAVTIFIFMLDCGFTHVLGTIFRKMLEKFGESRSKTATLQSLYVGVSFMSTTLSGLFISRWGVSRGILCTAVLMPVGFFASFFAQSMVYLFVSIGIIGGIGNSFALMGCVVAVGQSFSESERSLAMSILFTAVGTTTLVYPYIMSWLVELYGLNGAFLILSAVYLHTFFAHIVYRYEKETYQGPARKEEKGSKGLSNIARLSIDLASQISFSAEQINKDVDDHKRNENEMNSKSKNAIEEIRKRMSERKTRTNDNSGNLCSPMFLTFVLSSAIFVGSTTGFLSVAQDIFMDKGLSEPESLSGYLGFNLLSAVLRLIPALTSKLGLDTFIILLISSAVAMVGQIIIYWCSSHTAILVGSGLSGAAFGGYASGMPIKTFELLSVNKQAIGYGLLVTVYGIFSTGFGPLFGAIRDFTGEYTYVLIAAGSLKGLCCLINLMCLVYQRMKKRQKPPQARRVSIIL